MQVRWHVDETTTAIYLARLLRAGRQLPTWSAVLGEAAVEVESCLSQATEDLSAGWDRVLAASVGNRRADQISERCWSYSPPWKGQAQLYTQLDSAIGHLLQCFHRECDNAFQELSIRKGPLQNQWEARGPGMTHYVQAQAPFDLAADSTIIGISVVLPSEGGGGVALSEYRSVVLEGVLANPHPQLPEAVRLFWLLLQAATPAPKEPSFRKAYLLGTAVAAVKAGEHVEFITSVEDALSTAFTSWIDAAEINVGAEELDDWWHETAANGDSLQDALVGLAHRLG